ncbi:MAG: ROK family protein [Acidimicrobiia bacterium]
MRYLGLDLGGTNVKAAVLDVEAGGSPVVQATETRPTGAGEGPAAVTAGMIALGTDMARIHGPFAGVGVGVPGLFSFDTGDITFFTNLPGVWEGFPLRATIAEGLGVPATLINDARAFTLAEATVGAGRGCANVAALTLGTGVGGGLFINGELHFGAFGIGGELGHQTVAPDGPICGCGNRGCMEALTRASVITAAAGRPTMEDVLEGVATGDPDCEAALHSAATYLGIGLANIITVIGPERIVIGGGVAEAGDALLDPIRQAVRARVTLVPPEQVTVVAAELGATAGAIGAALAAVDSPTRDRRFLAGDFPSAQIRRAESGPTDPR